MVEVTRRRDDGLKEAGAWRLALTPPRGKRRCERRGQRRVRGFLYRPPDTIRDTDTLPFPIRYRYVSDTLRESRVCTKESAPNDPIKGPYNVPLEVIRLLNLLEKKKEMREGNASTGENAADTG